MKITLLSFVFFLTQTLLAETYVLLNDDNSSIQYRITKEAIVDVNGLANESSKDDLKGQVTFSDVKTLKDLKILVEWNKPLFDSGSIERDKIVQSALGPKLTLLFNSDKLAFDGKNIELTMVITINEQSVEVPVFGSIEFVNIKGNDFALFNGISKINRKDFDIILSKGAVGDKLIQDELDLRFELTFVRID